MGKFINGVWIGIGAGLLIAPMKGEEMRHRLGGNLQKLQSSFAEKRQSSLSASPSSGANALNDMERQTSMRARSRNSTSAGMKQPDMSSANRFNKSQDKAT